MKKFMIRFIGVFALVLLGAVSVNAQSVSSGASSTTVSQSGKATYTIAIAGLNDQKATWLKELEKEEVVESVSCNVAAGTCTITVFHPEVMTQEKVKATLENHIVFRSKSGSSK